MPYAASGLSLINYANGNSEFFYRTTDPYGEVFGAGYFNPSSAQFHPGDIIYIVAANGAHGSARVATNTAGVVVVRPGPGRAVLGERVSIVPLAQASTDFTLSLPPCTIMRITTRTTTAFTGASAALTVGTTVGGNEIVASVSVQSAGVVAHTVVAAAAAFAGGTIHLRLAQTTPTAVGLAQTLVEYVA